MKILGSTVAPVLASLAFLLPSITVIHNLEIEAPFSLKGAVLLQFMNVLFAQTSKIYYSESLRAFFHSMSLTSSWMFLIFILLLIYTESWWFALGGTVMSLAGGFKITGIALGGAKNRNACGSQPLVHTLRYHWCFSFSGIGTDLILHFCSSLSGEVYQALPQPCWSVNLCNPSTALQNVWGIFSWKVHLAHGWRWGLSDSWQEHCHLLLVMKWGWKMTSSLIWPGLKSGVYWLLALAGGIFTYRMPFL